MCFWQFERKVLLANLIHTTGNRENHAKLCFSQCRTTLKWRERMNDIGTNVSVSIVLNVFNALLVCKHLSGKKKEKYRNLWQEGASKCVISVVVLRKCFTGHSLCLNVQEIYNSNCFLSPLTKSGLSCHQGRCWPDTWPMQTHARWGCRVAGWSSFHHLHWSSQTAAPVWRADCNSKDF